MSKYLEKMLKKAEEIIPECRFAMICFIKNDNTPYFLLSGNASPMEIAGLLEICFYEFITDYRRHVVKLNSDSENKGYL